MSRTGIKKIAVNRKAQHDYFVHERYEAGIALVGTEVKSIRAGRVNLKDGFANVRGNELWLYNVHISPYEQGNIFNRDPLRTRKLLMKRSQIRYLDAKVHQKGFTLIPLSLYWKRGKVKVELGLCTGKKMHDKRKALAEKTAKREIDRALKDRVI